MLEEDASDKLFEEETSEKLIDEETNDKLKPVKCYIKEVNNNSEEDVKEQPKHLLMNKNGEIESSDQTKISR